MYRRVLHGKRKLTEGYAGIGNMEPDISPTTLAKGEFLSYCVRRLCS